MWPRFAKDHNLKRAIYGSYILKFGQNPASSLGDVLWSNCWRHNTWWTWPWSEQPLIIIYNQCLIRIKMSCKYNDFGFNSCGKMNISRFFPYKCIRNQIWPCHKVGQGQPRIIICANLVGSKSPILHTMSQGHWPYIPKKIFLKGLYHIWVWWSSWSCDWEHLCKLSFSHPKELPYEIWIGQVVSEKIENVDNRPTTDRHTTETLAY